MHNSQKKLSGRFLVQVFFKNFKNLLREAGGNYFTNLTTNCLNLEFDYSFRYFVLHIKVIAIGSFALYKASSALLIDAINNLEQHWVHRLVCFPLGK